MNLEQLWLNENMIETMKGFSKCRKLKELFMASNRIKKIRGLDSCTDLIRLWIDENRLEAIEGLACLPNLKELNLAANRIEAIGTGLDGLVALEDFNVANNRIGNFKEVLNLNRLSKLRVCTFNDPHYGDNPICNLCNY